MSKTLTLNGSNLEIKSLVDLARNPDIIIDICAKSQARLLQGRKIVEKIIQRKQAVYGITTGLGSKVTELLSDKALVSFSYQTIRGRAHSLGDPMCREIVRAAMIIRLNTLLLGYSGASPALADFLTVAINKNVTPVIGNIGSIGASDLCWGASMALSFIGEGEMFDQEGNIVNAAGVLQSLDITPLKLQPKDGLVLANHSGFSAALSTLAFDQCRNFLTNANATAAMTMQAMRANLSPMDDFVLHASPDSGVDKVARHIRSILKDSELNDLNTARKIQDPLSIRNSVQVHGALQTAIDFAAPIITQQLNASSDNPVVDIENQRVVSSGGYYSCQLTLVMETMSRALEQVVVTQLARISKLLSHRHSGLPQFLALPEANSNAFAPTLKLAEALLADIKKCLTPVDCWPSINAEGVEDIQNHAPLAAKSLAQALVLCEKLCAMEMIMACQGIDLGLASDADKKSIPFELSQIHKRVRNTVPVLQCDRPMGLEIEMLASLIQRNQLI